MRFFCVSLALIAPVTASASATELYWTHFNDGGDGGIRRTNTATLVTQPVIATGLSQPGALKFDPSGGMIYWSDVSSGAAGGIRRARLDGTQIAQIVVPSTEARYTYGLAIDSQNGHIYFSEYQVSGGLRSVLMRANLDGSEVQQLLDVGSTLIQDIDVDPVNRRLYFSQWDSQPGHTGQLRRMNLDGTGLQDILPSVLNGPTGIDLEVATGFVYWGRFGPRPAGGFLQRASLDGHNVVTIADNSEFNTIAVDAADGRIYWTDRYGSSPNSILRVNLDGLNRQYFAGGSFLDGIALVPEPITPILFLMPAVLVGRVRVRRRA